MFLSCNSRLFLRVDGLAAIIRRSGDLKMFVCWDMDCGWLRGREKQTAKSAKIEQRSYRLLRRLLDEVGACKPWNSTS
jgi:hypothetical protein